MRVLAALVAVLAFAGFAGAADEKIDAKKLIGKWEPSKPEKDGPKLVLEIGEKGKFTLHVTIGGKTENIDGTYKLEGNKLDIEMTFGGKTEKETITITKLTDTELVAKDSKGKEDTMTRVKDKK